MAFEFGVNPNSIFIEFDLKLNFDLIWLLGAQKDLMANMPGKTEVDPEEEKRQQEQLEAMDQAEQERKKKWQKQENAREGMRAGIRDKVSPRNAPIQKIKFDHARRPNLEPKMAPKQLSENL